MIKTILQEINWNNRLDSICEDIHHNVALPEINEEYLQKVGLFIARFQRLEYSIKQFILHQANNNRICQQMLDNLPFSGLLKILKNNIPKSIIDKNDFEHLIVSTEKLNRIRNIIVHAIYLASWEESLNLFNKTNAFYQLELNDFNKLIWILGRLIDSFSWLTWQLLLISTPVNFITE